MSEQSIPLAEQIAAVERAHRRQMSDASHHRASVQQKMMSAEADRLAAALATLRGLQERAPKLVCPVCGKGDDAWINCNWGGCCDGRGLQQRSET